jgi:hypothetical protein
MTLDVDPDVKAIAEFMQSTVAASRLVGRLKPTKRGLTPKKRTQIAKAAAGGAMEHP